MHGLDGDREETWTARNRVFWLKDPECLQKAFPSARILTYGYAGYSRTHGNKQRQHQTLYGHGQELVSDLWLERQNVLCLFPHY